MDSNKKFKIRIKCRNCHNTVDIYKDEIKPKYRYGVIRVTEYTNEEIRNGICNCVRNIEPGDIIYFDIISIKYNKEYAEKEEISYEE